MSKSIRFYKSVDNQKVTGRPSIVRCTYQRGLKKSDLIPKKK